MKGIKNGLQVANMLGLNNVRARGNISYVLQPKLVMIGMDDIMRRARNPHRLVREESHGTIQLNSRFINIHTGDASFNLMDKGLNRCSWSSGYFSKNQVAVSFMLSNPVSLLGLDQSAFETSDIKQHRFKNAMSNGGARTKLRDTTRVRRTNRDTAGPPSRKGRGKTRSTQDGIPKSNPMQNIPRGSNSVVVNPPAVVL
jgi:hypothetical protein